MNKGKAALSCDWDSAAFDITGLPKLFGKMIGHSV